MKVYVYPADEFGCGHYRLIWPARVLQMMGHDVEVVMPGERRGIYSETNQITNRVEKVRVPADADVMVFQRPTHKNLVPFIKMVVEGGVAVVIDIDDDLSRVDPNHPAFGQLHPRSIKNTDHNWQVTIDCCEAATWVQVSTPALVNRYARHGRATILYNCVPGYFLDITHPDSDVVGWGGSVQSHPNDLQVMGPALSRLVRDDHVDVKFIGPMLGIERATGLKEEEFSYTGTVLFEQWPHRLAELGVGVAPLADTQFNAAKSWLKPLEMAAVGVPSVMSPSVEYERLRKLGIGVTARKPQQWYARIKELVRNDSLREEMSQSGRAAAKDFTYEQHAWRWMEAWTDAYRYARRNYQSPLLRS